MTLVAATPLGRGLFTSAFADGTTSVATDDKDMRPKFMPRFKEENRAENVRVVGEFKALAERKGCTLAQLALAWLMKQGSDVVPIPGTKKMKYLEENWKSLDVELSDEDEMEVREFMAGTEIAGHYMPEKFMHYMYRDTKEEA